MAIYIKGDDLTPADIEHYTQLNLNRGIKPTGETIHKISDRLRESQTKVVFKGSWTPFGVIRDCGDHYIEALYSSYRWISKDLQHTMEDVEDC